MKTTINAFIMRLLGVLMFSFIVGSFVKTIESHETKVFVEFMQMSKDIVADIVPGTINSEVAFLDVVPTYTAYPHIGLQMNMSNNILECSYTTRSGVYVSNPLVGGNDDPVQLDPDSG